VSLRVEVVPFALRFREPYVTARGSLERRECILLRLHDSDGLVGLGEAVPLSLRGGADLATVAGELAASAGQVQPGMSAPAKAAIALARLDLEGKRGGDPAWRILGAAKPEPVRCNATLTAGDPAAVGAQAEWWARQGFETFKVKAGTAGDVRTVEAVRAAVGEDARIRVDANGAWNPDEAAIKLGAMEAFGIELAEQPAAGLEEMALVRAETAIPIAADESVASATDAARAVELGACSLATVKLSKVGGFDPAREIAARLPVYLSSALDGPVGIAAAGHFAIALGEGDAGLAHGLATQLLFEETVATVGPVVDGGQLHLPEGPGLGVEVDQQALDRLRI
jgi:L-Ala-D/L-Glu epimerase / N-acetyl-D-glutamate racemase